MYRVFGWNGEECRDYFEEETEDLIEAISWARHYAYDGGYVHIYDFSEDREVIYKSDKSNNAEDILRKIHSLEFSDIADAFNQIEDLLMGNDEVLDFDIEYAIMSQAIVGWFSMRSNQEVHVFDVKRSTFATIIGELL